MAFKNVLQQLYAIGGGKPIWISESGVPLSFSFSQELEYGYADGFGVAIQLKALGTDQEIMNFLTTVMPWLDAQPWIERSAWNGEPGLGSGGQLWNSAGTGLTPLGQEFDTLSA